MNWVPIALLTALSLSTADALTKRALKDSDELIVAWVRWGYALPFLAVAFAFTPIPALDSTFWLSVAALLPLEVTALFLYVRAIRLSPLSLTIPFLALTPAFIVLIAFILLGEVPSLQGLFGIILITVGAYALNAKEALSGVAGPFRAIAREPGSILMIIVAFIYSITSTLGKLAVAHSSPVFFGAFYPFLLTAAISAFVIYRKKVTLVFSRPRLFIPIGFLMAVMVLTHFIAISLTQAAYMISIKRMSLVFSVIYGRVIFKEMGLKERLLGSVVMLAGAALIILS
ncbi:MAG: DMT family transporter [Deltaproteobacteria bacterium]|nr:DMT family transporter [Deltaproteobacteria bacterium]